MPLLGLAVLALLAAMWAGLIRLGWLFPPLVQGINALHGPLIVSGFLGTVISAERAVALDRRWAYGAPLASGLGAALLLLRIAPPLSALLLALGSAGMVAIFYVIVRREPAIYTYTMAAGALAWLAGNVLWVAGLPFPSVALWWTTFLVLTIVGERLELSRLLKLPAPVQRLFVAAVALLIAAVVIDMFERMLAPRTGLFLGSRMAGVALIALAVWLLRYDIARRTVRQRGITRFMALCLLLGYVWLGVGGALRLVFAGTTGGPEYDAILHTVFLGFVFSMILGHAPIILPAVLSRPMAYTPLMYVPLALLHLSLVLRLAGDLLFGLTVRQWGGMLNVIAILLFLGVTARALVGAKRAKSGVT